MKPFRIFTMLTPRIVTLIYVTVILTAAIVTEIEPRISYATQVKSIMWAALFVIPIGWSIGVYAILMDTNYSMSKKSIFLFRIISVMSLLYSAMIVLSSFFVINIYLSESFFLETLLSAVNIAGIISIPMTFWVAAKKVVDYENKFEFSSKGVVLTFLKVIYFPIGVYWLFPRIKRIKSSINPDNTK